MPSMFCPRESPRLESSFLLECMDGTADPSRIPTYKPAFRSFLVDDVGNLWVFPSMQTDDIGTLIDVFDTECKYLGQLRPGEELRMSPTPVVQRGRLDAVVLDETDVPYVIRYRVNGSRSR